MAETERKYYWLLLNKKETKAFKDYLDNRGIYYETVEYPDPLTGQAITKFGCLMYKDEAEAAGHWLELFRGGRKVRIN